MAPHLPEVTFGLPVYNGEQHLSQAIESIRAQTVENIEIIISDNASTDGTEEICREAAAHDARIRYVRHEVNMGGPRNFNATLAMAQAPYFTWVAADDAVLPEFYERCVAGLDDDAVLSFGGTRLIDESSEVIGTVDDESLFDGADSAVARAGLVLSTAAFQLLGGLYRTSALRSTRGILPNAASDIVLLVELACLGAFVRVDGDVNLRRMHPQQASRQGQHAVGWYKPNVMASRFALLHTKIARDLVTAALRAPLPAREKAGLLATLGPSWLRPRAYGFREDLTVLLRPPTLRGPSAPRILRTRWG